APFSKAALFRSSLNTAGAFFLGFFVLSKGRFLACADTSPAARLSITTAASAAASHALIPPSAKRRRFGSESFVAAACRSVKRPPNNVVALMVVPASRLFCRENSADAGLQQVRSAEAAPQGAPHVQDVFRPRGQRRHPGR